MAEAESRDRLQPALRQSLHQPAFEVESVARLVERMRQRAAVEQGPHEARVGFGRGGHRRLEALAPDQRVLATARREGLAHRRKAVLGRAAVRLPDPLQCSGPVRLKIGLRSTAG